MEEAEEFVSLMPSLAYLELVARTSICYLKVIAVELCLPPKTTLQLRKTTTTSTQTL